MSDNTHTPPRFVSLSEFLERPEDLATVEELSALGPWKASQIRYWLYESGRNGLEAGLMKISPP
jgi:hypothetical protein